MNYHKTETDYKFDEPAEQDRKSCKSAFTIASKKGGVTFLQI